MDASDEKPGTPVPPTEPASAHPAGVGSPEVSPVAPDSPGNHEDPYGYSSHNQAGGAVKLDQQGIVDVPPPRTAAPVVASGGGRQIPPPPPAGDDEEPDEDGMLRMSFLEHLEELRSRIIKALFGVAVSFFLCLFFANDLWNIVSAPAIDALTSLGVKPPRLAQLTPMEVFSTVWVKMPLLVSIFVASPWVLYQVWAFIAPGLYKKERRMAAPFILSAAGLFITGGLFAYFVAFRFGLTFLLGIGRDINIAPVVSVTEYFDLFVNVTLGVALVFEMPVVIFFLTLLRIASPRFLLSNSRYAILLITIIAAIVTPTPDVFNLMLFAVPMYLLFFVGIFASYLLVLKRENKGFPWRLVIMVVGIPALLIAGGLYLAVAKYGFHLANHWPFLIK